MDRIHPLFTVSKSLSLLLLILLQTSAEAQICSAKISVNFVENNTVNAVVETIITQPGVTLEFSPPPANPNNPFILDGNDLVAATVLDFEIANYYEVGITCTETATGSKLSLLIVVFVTNKNDNPPVFSQDSYPVNVNEMDPVGTSVGSFPATDKDQHPQLFYTLTSPSNEFVLKSPTAPDILINTRLDYDKVKNVELILTVRDTTILPEDVVYSASATILVTIVDVDNRPPWFQPCTPFEIGGNIICQSPGYTGRVVLNEQETGVLPLEPGALYAIDGDSGINEAIAYSFLSGNEDGLFAINPNTGNITMLKPADVLGTISLSVLAAQAINSHQFATTTVTISVQVKSLHRPVFQKPLYEGLATSVGTMVTDLTNKDQPLRILATDDDYAATGGVNPHITYSITGSSDFTVIDGYLFMTKDLPESTLTLQIVAKDTTNDESDTSNLSVEVKSDLTTTKLPLSTTNVMTTTPNGEPTTDSRTTGNTVSIATPTEESTTDSKITGSAVSTTDPSISTSKPSSTSEGSNPTSKPTTTTGEGSNPTSKPTTTTGEGSNPTTEPTTTTGEGSNPTTEPTVPAGGTSSTPDPTGEMTTTSCQPESGGNNVVGMAVLGAVLGALLLICLVIIGVLVCRLRKGKEDWRKIKEASIFRSSLGQGSGGHKEGIQYTNEAFQKDEDGSSLGSGGSVRERVIASKESPQTSWNTQREEAIIRSSAALHDLLPDNSSDTSSERADSEKDVKPILTKERRVEEGYKSVWFKEDIDPDAKEEVVIIPDSREDDSEEEDDEPSRSSREEDDDDNPPTKKIFFADSDLDSGIGVKTEDPPEDSDSEESMDHAL